MTSLCGSCTFDEGLELNFSRFLSIKIKTLKDDHFLRPRHESAVISETLWTMGCRTGVSSERKSSSRSLAVSDLPHQIHLIEREETQCSRMLRPEPSWSPHR